MGTAISQRIRALGAGASRRTSDALTRLGRAVQRLNGNHPRHGGRK